MADKNYLLIPNFFVCDATWHNTLSQPGIPPNHGVFLIIFLSSLLPHASLCLCLPIARDLTFKCSVISPWPLKTRMETYTAFYAGHAEVMLYCKQMQHGFGTAVLRQRVILRHVEGLSVAMGGLRSTRCLRKPHDQEELFFKPEALRSHGCGVYKDVRGGRMHGRFPGLCFTD